MKNISELIKMVVMDMGLSPREINNGQCEDFALKIASKVEGSSEVCTENFVEFGVLPGHVWILFGGKHYDAECPEGTKNFMMLPIFLKMGEKEIEALKKQGYRVSKRGEKA